MSSIITKDLATSAAVIDETISKLSSDVSPLNLRSAFGQFPSGVVALAGYANGLREGMAASSFTVGVSLEPALVSVAVQNTSRTWPRLRQAERIGVTVLGQNQDSVCRQLASKDGDRFAGLEATTSDGGGIFLYGGPLWLETSIYAEYPAGDHQVVLLQVHALEEFAPDTEPLVFHRSKFRPLWPAKDND